MINQELANKVVKIALDNDLPVQLSKLLAAQAAHETGNFKSNAFLKNNNGFGYKYFPKSDYQLGAGITSTEKDPYAHYASFDNSIKEVVAWIKRRVRKAQFPADLTKIQQPEDYAKLLKQCGYYGGPLEDYISGLTFYLTQIK